MLKIDDKYSFQFLEIIENSVSKINFDDLTSFHQESLKCQTLFEECDLLGTYIIYIHTKLMTCCFCISLVAIVEI